jgi:hypothetical protein
VTKPGRPPVLDEIKQREILAILSVGCSRRTAARYVGCAPTTIQNTADRDPKFAEKLRHAENQAELTWLKNINTAAKKEQYWRAAAWALEHIKPEQYAKRHPNVITVEQISQLLSQFAQIVSEEIPVDKYRKAVLNRFEELQQCLKEK